MLSRDIFDVQVKKEFKKLTVRELRGDVEHIFNGFKIHSRICEFICFVFLGLVSEQTDEMETSQGRTRTRLTSCCKRKERKDITQR